MPKPGKPIFVGILLTLLIFFFSLLFCVHILREQNDFQQPTKILALSFQEADVSIIIKTMNRERCLHTLVSAIRKSNPQCYVLIADDGVEPHNPLPQNDSFIRYYQMPYDSGLSAARNLLVSQVTTPLFLLLDDDFSWRATLVLEFLSVLQKHPYLDIIGGQAGLPFAGKLQVSGKTLLLMPDIIAELSGVNCSQVDFVPNFFLARADRISQLRWDSDLKVNPTHQHPHPHAQPYLHKQPMFQ